MKNFHLGAPAILRGALLTMLLTGCLLLVNCSFDMDWGGDWSYSGDWEYTPPDTTGYAAYRERIKESLPGTYEMVYLEEFKNDSTVSYLVEIELERVGNQVIRLSQLDSTRSPYPVDLYFKQLDYPEYKSLTFLLDKDTTNSYQGVYTDYLNEDHYEITSYIEVDSVYQYFYLSFQFYTFFEQGDAVSRSYVSFYNNF